MMVTIHLSAGFSPPSGMLQPGGYQIPPPQHLYSGGGRHQPSSAPPQLQQGMTKCVHTLSCTAMFVSKLTVIFPGLPSQQHQYMKPHSISSLYLIIYQCMYHVATIVEQNEQGN